MDFIFAPEEKRNTNVELEETFIPQDEDDLKSPMSLIQKIKREVKTDEHQQHEAIRVNLMSRLLDSVHDLEVESGEITDEMTFGQEVAYNTLFNYGFLKEI